MNDFTNTELPWGNAASAARPSNVRSYRRVHPDYWLLLLLVLLVALGIVMVYSASAVLAQERFGDAYYFLKREFAWVLISTIMGCAVAIVPYHFWRRNVYIVLGVAAVLLLLSFVPGLRSESLGAARWLQLGPIRFQPSETVKLAFVIFMAYSMEKKSGRMHHFSMGMLPHLIMGGGFALLMLGQSDFGSAATLGAIMICLLFIGGARPMHLLAIAIAATPLVYYAIAGVSYRRARIMAFLDPWSDRYGSGFQIIQSLISYHQGGVMGRGLGEGQQKLFYLPEAHTDFIAAVLAEELGLWGTLLLIALFIAICARGFQIAWRAADLFGRYCALGITLMIAIQTLLNLGVVMGILPTKGLVLPFISYGGSALLSFVMATAVLWNISSYHCDNQEHFA